MLFTVYSPDGEMFEVPPRIAKELIVEKGWNISPPKTSVVEKEEPTQEEPEVVTPRQKNVKK